MAIEVFNRHENKYLLENNTYEKVLNELCEYMDLDEYCKAHSFYTISNLYYDTYDNRLIRTSLSKPKYKEKLRLRAYGVPSLEDKIFVEIKKKVNGIVNKRRSKLILNDAYNFLDTGQKPRVESFMNHQVINEIDYFLNLYNPVPKLYLAYDRIAYFGSKNKDLRITFDFNIRTRRRDLRLENGDHGDTLLNEGIWLMEVKAEKSIPIWLVRILSENKLYKVSFSKYGREYKSMIAKNVMEEELVNA